MCETMEFLQTDAVHNSEGQEDNLVNVNAYKAALFEADNETWKYLCHEWVSCCMADGKNFPCLSITEDDDKVLYEFKLKLPYSIKKKVELIFHYILYGMIQSLHYFCQKSY